MERKTPQQQPTAQPKRPKAGRSPAYPAISLKTALAKAKAQHDSEGNYPAPMPSAFKAWGFGEKSSGGRDVRAALKYFGLATVEGDSKTGKVKLTQDAIKVLLDPREDQSEKKALIRRLALAPVIHKKLYAQFPEGIKSDGTAKHFLMFEQGYNEKAAGEVIDEFKETATFAELFKPGVVVDKSDLEIGPEGEEDADNGGELEKPLHKPPVVKNQVQIMAGERELTTGLLSKGSSFRLIVSGPVGVKEIERLIAKLELDKEILGEADEEGGSETGNG